ncbi:hypothetical protein [Azohydromonas aeria]|uniref:hypothetical protein n=1 Tax=Azohydromonas aeria TaxID=2590212 RepID=UPI0012FAB52B|nr:hypothetical protein [Azohydromonas aeria]
MPALQAPARPRADDIPELPPGTPEAVERLARQHNLTDAGAAALVRLLDSVSFTRYRTGLRAIPAATLEMLLLRLDRHPTLRLAWRDETRTEPHPERDLPALPPCDGAAIEALAQAHGLSNAQGARLMRIADPNTFSRYRRSGGVSAQRPQPAAHELLLLRLGEHPSLRLVVKSSE